MTYKEQPSFYFVCLSLSLLLQCIMAVPTKAQENGVPSECTEVLLQRNLSLLNTYEYSTVVYLNSIDEEQFNKLKQSASATVPGYFSGTWSDFQESRRKLSVRTSYSASVEQSLSALTSVGLPGATDSWLSCIELKSGAGAFFGTVMGSPEGLKFVVKVKWKPVLGTGETPIKIVGSSVPTIPVGTEIANGTTGFDISRADKKQDILLYVTGKSGTLNRTFPIFVPAFKDLPPPPPPIPVIFGSCIGRGGMEGVWFWGPAGADCNGVTRAWGKYQIDPTVRLPTRLASCKGGGGGPSGIRLWGPEGEKCGGMNGWGVYADEPVPISGTEVCSCLGNGGLAGQELWGPRGKPCGGVPPNPGWGTYSQHCLTSTTLQFNLMN